MNAEQELIKKQAAAIYEFINEIPLGCLSATIPHSTLLSMALVCAYVDKAIGLGLDRELGKAEVWTDGATPDEYTRGFQNGHIKGHEAGCAYAKTKADAEALLNAGSGLRIRILVNGIRKNLEGLEDELTR